MKETLLKLAEKYLNDESYLNVEENIEAGKLDDAKSEIFGGMIAAFIDNDISESDFKKDLESLQISDELKEDIKKVLNVLFQRPN